MNVFGAFNFGRLIKTFLPGFIILMSILLCIDASMVLMTSNYLFLKWTVTNPIWMTFISIPLSLICGIISNILFFIYFNDRVIRNPFNEANKEFNEIQDQVFTWINTHLQKKRVLPNNIFENFKEYIDLEYFLLPSVSVENLLFLQESYWYYLEFQTNMSLATIVFVFSAFFWSLIYFPVLQLTFLAYILSSLVFLAISFFIMFVSIKAAKLNYQRHRKKLLNLLVGSVYAETLSK